MASLDFEREKLEFAAFYEANLSSLENASEAITELLADLMPQLSVVPISKIESRVKSCDECIRKFDLKYLQLLEETAIPYSIKEHIDDLIGLRIVCLYEDDIEKIGQILESEFDVLDVTNKIITLEQTEGSFGYKGLHFDLKLKKGASRSMPQLQPHEDLRFEVQVRTIIQDSWSVLDHQIKYKKSIPNHLKRRINTLAALFELADREFRHIRDATAEEMKQVEIEPGDLAGADLKIHADASTTNSLAPAHLERRSAQLNAFSFIKIATHFFPAFEFEPQKVDSFVEQILAIQPSITRSEFNERLRAHIGFVKRYQADFESKSNSRMNPYTIMRHCLYLGHSSFQEFLSNAVRKNFESWIGTR